MKIIAFGAPKVICNKNISKYIDKAFIFLAWLTAVALVTQQGRCATAGYMYKYMGNNWIPNMLALRNL